MAGDKKDKERKISGKARFEILLEDINGKMDAMLEGREVTDNKIDRLEQKVDANREELLEMIRISNQSLTEEIKNVEVKLGQRIDKVEQEVTGIKQEVKEVNHKLDKVIVRQDRQEERQDKQEIKIDSFCHPAH